MSNPQLKDLTGLAIGQFAYAGTLKLPGETALVPHHGSRPPDSCTPLPANIGPMPKTP
nr:hypothetical protein [uncultured Gellertiella sp.]